MDDVEKVKSKLDLVDIIGNYVPLKKAGRNFKAICPFHGEKTPSFIVSPERQIWHCFSCGKGGDVFSFLQDYENITFSESLKELAVKAGVKLTTTPARTDRERKQELIYSLNHLAQQFYNYLLLSHPAGKRALRYLLEERKMTIPLITTFSLGYAPNNDALVKFLIGKKKYKEDDLVLAGLAFQRGRTVSDFFRNRIIFPIIDHRGNTVAFSGRQLDQDSNSGKYVNTKETPVYVKGDSLYGLNLAKDAIKKEGKVIIVEGEFDVISAHREGISNIVAVKGTALGENQIKLLKRFAPKFAFCFDTDRAGVEAQRRSIALIENEGITASVIVPSSGKDPDELLNENPVAFKKAMKEDKNMYDYIIESAIQSTDIKTAEGKKSILSKTLPFIATIQNEVIREHYLKKLAGLLDASFEAISHEADKSIKPETVVQATAPKAGLPRQEILEIYLLSLIFQSKNPKANLILARSHLANVPLSTPPLEKVLNHLEKYQQPAGDFSPSAFTKILPDELHISFDTAYLSPISQLEGEKFEHELEKCAKQVKTGSIKRRLTHLAELISEAEKKRDENELQKRQEEFDKYTKLLAG